MRDDTSTSPTTTAGEDLLARIDHALESYGHLREFMYLVVLLADIKEHLEDDQDSGE